ncbi:MAG: L-seryl-tRNA(Sec) selenium transferase [Bacteroidota bacterium]
MLNNELKKIPSVDRILSDNSIIKLKETFNINLITNAIRNIISNERKEILGGKKAKGASELCSEIVQLVKKITTNSYRPVINATGIILHTNLGRAPLGNLLVNEIMPVIAGYSNLEFDLNTTKRGKRAEHIKDIIKLITDAEDTEIVNNNAAAIILALKTFTENKEVIISRGELVEIGGSFRIPEIMKTSGAIMVEVGTTNRTCLEDYEKAITKNTRVLFKAHKSNYFIKGFTDEVKIRELAALAKKNNLISMYDIGSGLLKKLNKLPFLDEPNVQSAIKDGADLVMFSCDKLLGGPQAGIITGRKGLISSISRSPLMRALRVDKITIALLTSILKLYFDEEELIAKVPLFNMLCKTKEELFTTALTLQKHLHDHGINSEVIESKAQCGGGSLPQLELNSYAVKLLFESANKKLIDNLYKKLINDETPILSVLREGDILFDVLTIQPSDINKIAGSVSSSISDLIIKK